MDELDELFQTAHYKNCWYTRLPKEAQEDLDAIMARSKEMGRPPVWKKVSQRLESKYDVIITPPNISRHFRGDCRCQTT